MHQTCYSGAILAIPALLGLGAASGSAQDLPELTVETPVHGVHVIHGDPGGNVLVVETAKGIVLVDAQSADVSDSLVAVVRSFSTMGPQVVINTHYHEDHIAGNSVFREIGAETVAHRNVQSVHQAIPRLTIARGDDVQTTLSLGLANDFANGRGGESAASRFVAVLYLGMNAGQR